MQEPIRTVYLDNSATSFPKAPGVSEAMKLCIDTIGAGVNRSSYRAAQEAGMTVLETRLLLKELFRFPHKVTHVVLTPGATYSLNFAISGFLKPGDRVLTGCLEHNAVMRPLNAAPGVTFDRIPGDSEGFLSLDAAEKAIRPDTKLCVLQHASNVSGTLQQLEPFAELMHRKGIPLVVDAAQSAGHVEIDFGALGLAALCAPGHKGLLGPAGVGVLLLDPAFAKQLTPVITGGTGSLSESEVQPDLMPDRFESGTVNLAGIFGLNAALRWLRSEGIAKLRAHEILLARRFISGLSSIPGIRLAGPTDPERRVGVYSVDFPNRDNAEAADLLETRFGIMTRCGLHCAPNAHKTLGTWPQGSVRFSTGPFTTEEEIDAALEAIRIVAEC
ncbi:MAG: aminotransferase class V-fold PLP-dependent enzyme [Clostridia bacterium]|nr:aminotransferase class V-fold PLP-dependent enzyme [Clostridia bacterium]